MADFRELAKAIGEKRYIDTEEKITDLKAQKTSMNQMIDIALSQAELVKTEQKANQDAIKYEQKRDKLKADLVKTMIDNQANKGPMAIGGDLVGQYAPEVAPDARDMPMIDVNAKS